MAVGGSGVAEDGAIADEVPWGGEVMGRACEVMGRVLVRRDLGTLSVVHAWGVVTTWSASMVSVAAVGGADVGVVQASLPSEG